MTDRPHTVSIADDDRARIPFALIAVLLLVSSIMIVGVLESRDTPTVDTDNALAMDRAESVAVGELRQAVLRAADDAASAPVTSTEGADAAFSNAVDEDEAVFDQYFKLLIYREVSESFANAEQQVDQDTTARASVERIDWGDSDDLEAAIDRVSIDRREPGVLTVDIDGIKLTVTESDGETVTEQRSLAVTVGTPLYQLKDRTEEFQSQLNKGFFETDGYDGFGRYFAARMYPYTWGKAYYDRLSSGDRAFHNLTPNEHTEVMVNDAVFGLQEKTFGTTDPSKDRAMLLPTLCMGSDLASSAGDVETEDFLPGGENNSLANESNLCNADLIDAEGELPDAPTVQDIVLTMLEDNVETDVEIQAHPFADVSYMQMAAGMDMEQVEAEFNESLGQTDRFNSQYLENYFSDELENQGMADRVGSFRDDESGVLADVEELFLTNYPQEDGISKIIEKVYAVDVKTTENGPYKHDSLPNPTSPAEWAQNPGNWSGPINQTYHADQSQSDVDVTINIISEDNNTSFDNRDLAKIDINYDTSVGVKSEWKHKDVNRSPRIRWNWKENVTYSASYKITGDFVSDEILTEREKRGIQSLFRGDSWNEEYGFVKNFNGSENIAIRETFGLSSTSIRYQERELEDEIVESSDGIIHTPDFKKAIPYSADPDIDVSPRNREKLYEWALSDLNQTHYDVITTTEPHQTDLWDMVERPSPLGGIEKNVSKLERKLVYEDASEPYNNTADLLRAEVRKQYFENTHDNIDLINGWHDKTLGESSAILNDLFGGVLDTSNDLLSGPMNFIDQMMDPETRPQDTQASFNQSPLVDDMDYRVEASPTYLSLESVNRTEVPAVRPHSGNTLSVSNINDSEHAPMGAGYLDGVGHPGFPLLPWPSLFYLQLDAYYVKIQGEYARFEVRSNAGSPTTNDGMTYVQQASKVTIETPSWADQEDLAVGSVEPISFANDLVIPIIAPSPQLMSMGSPGVGDTWRYKGSDSPQEKCSVAWKNTGPNFNKESSSCISKEKIGISN
ncbi:hypothetical protein [Natrinema versiforme]|uniref:Uncharacterized protein n=1 Tax=Natrinema versiforme TaxID=88724 RepID=A0A4V1FZA4_9EURY|nr:hypothetical protein [Natrinema versiforme]QCS41605.1 hypothetical protein FEJ81_04275 [Natrinema versiforme]